MPNAARTHKALVVDQVKARISDASASIVCASCDVAVVSVSDVAPSKASGVTADGGVSD